MAKPAPAVQGEPAAKRAHAPPVQASLVVGAVNDPFEHEAERVADQVMKPGAALPPASAPAATAGPPPVITALSARRVAAPPNTLSGPEQSDEEAAAPEARAQRASRMSGPEVPSTPEPDLDDDKVAQAAPAGGGATGAGGAGGGVTSTEVEASVDTMRAGPAPSLDGVTRQQMESRLGTDLGQARVHAGAEAGQAAASLGARAFTVGQDMFFAPGEYQPATKEGQRLIAHELTHTIQQGGGSAGAHRAQRKPGTAEDKSTATPVAGTAPPKPVEVLNDSTKTWSVDLVGVGAERKFLVPMLELPTVNDVLKGTTGAGKHGRPEKDKPFTRPPQQSRAKRIETAAYQLWNTAIRDKPNRIENILENRLNAQASKASVVEEGGKPVYVLKRTGSREAKDSASLSEFLLVGTLEELAKHDGVVRPMLTNEGKFGPVDVDHILDDQLGGLDDMTNFWLLDRKYNQSIGPQIGHRIKTSINQTLKKARTRAEELKKEGVKVDGRKLPQDFQAVLRNWTLVFNSVGAGKFNGAPSHFWTQDQIKAGAHVKHYEALTETELFRQGFKFDKKKKILPTKVNVFPNKAGGQPTRFSVSKDGQSLEKPENLFGGIAILGKAFKFTPPSEENQNHVLTRLKVHVKTKGDKRRGKEPLDVKIYVDVQHDTRLGFGGYFSKFEVYQAAAEGLSPVTLTDPHVSPDGELTARGTISSSKLLLPGLEIPIELRGSDLLVNFPIPAEGLSFGPVKVLEPALEIGVGDQGFFLAGSAVVAIDGVGQGALVAMVKGGDVTIGGTFALDLTFLDPAEIDLLYSVGNDTLTGKATLVVKKGLLPGVESGKVDIVVSRDTFGLTGSLTLGGVLAGSVVTVGYMPETGLLIEGKDLPLPIDKLPGVSDAKATVTARRDPETGDWSVGGGGKATISAAGAKGSLDVLVDGDAVTVKGRGDVAKGPATGWLEITATNQATDEEGNPVEGAPVGDLRIWGKGEASITFGKILTGTAGLEYTPDGRVIISGEIALPPKFELFPKLGLGKPKELLSLSPPDFWIWGVKVGPVGFGIFGFVDAKVTFQAFAGPGELLDTKVSATLDLDKPEEATVTGHAEFYVPAVAELKLDVGGGVKAQVAVAYVKGRIGLDGTLAAMVEVRLPVDVSWSAAKGLAFGGKVMVNASPKFELGVNASITAGVDLGIWEPSKTWGPWRKKLGEFGPDMALSMELPLSWSEENGLSFESIEPKEPNLDAASLMGDAFDTLV